MRKIYLGILIVFLSFFTACKKSEDLAQAQKEVLLLHKKISKEDVKIRLAKWDSLLVLPNYDIYQKANIIFFKANDNLMLLQYEDAIKLYQKALPVFEKVQDKLMIAKVNINMGIAYAYLNKKTSASEHVFRGLDIAKEMGEDKLVSRAYSELSHIYYLFDDKEKVLEYLQKVSKMQEKQKDTIGLSTTFNNMAITYQQLGQNQKAYNLALKAISLDEKVKDEISLIDSYNNFGSIILMTKNDLKEALKYYNKALALAKKNKIKYQGVYENIAEIYQRKNMLDSAHYFLNKAIEHKSSNINAQIHIYNKLLKLNLQRNKDLADIELLRIKDSLLKEKEKINLLENKKNIENNLTLLSKAKQLRQARQINKKNRIIFIFIIVIFILGILISFQLNRFDKLKYRQEKFILEQKVLRSQMNPHFIFNVLSSIQNTLIQNNPMKSVTYLSKFAQLIRLNFEFVSRQNISLKEEMDILKSYLDTQQFRYKDKFEYSINIDPEIDILETQVPPMILQPFVENAIEHGFKNIDYTGKLTINIFVDNKKLCFEVIDNGQGYKPKKSNKEHALDVFKRRMELLGKEEVDSFKIVNLDKGVKVIFCFTKNISLSK